MTARSISRSVAGPFARSIVGRIIRDIWTPAKLFADGQQGLWLEASPTYKGQQVLWQQSDGTIIVDANGDPVGRDDDLSPNGNNATQATSADRPTYNTDGALHWLGFDGAGDNLGVAGSSSAMKFMHSAGGCTVVAGIRVGDGAALSDTYYPILGTNGNAASTVGISLSFDNRTGLSRQNRIFANLSDGTNVAITASENDYVSPNTDYVVSAQFSDSEVAIWKNGGNKRASSVGFPPSTANSSHDLKLGTAGGVSPGLLGREFAVIIFEGVDAAKRRKAEEYIAGLLGITL